jgi:hypothetical protein
MHQQNFAISFPLKDVVDYELMPTAPLGKGWPQSEQSALPPIFHFKCRPSIVRGHSVAALLAIRARPANLARDAPVDHLLVDSTGILEPLSAAEPRLGRRTARTLPLLPPPQKN